MTAPTRLRARPALWLTPLVCAGALLSGCAALPSTDRVFGLVTPYKVEVVQGNVITKEQAAQIKPGQTRAQVRDILGSPLLMDVFHADRWDYVFTIRRQGAAPQQRQVIVRFDADQLKSMEAPDLPSERDFVASIDTFKTSRNAPALALTDAQIQALPVPVARPATAATAKVNPSEPARIYPPLEPR